MLKPEEQFALGHVLSDWPEELTYEEVLEAIAKDSDVLIWEPFENYPADYVTNTIKSHHSSALLLLRPYREALTRAEAFIAGFEGDELQEGVPELLNLLRNLLGDTRPEA